MTGHDLVEQLLELPDAEAQRQFIQQHQSPHGDELAQALKAQADHFMRDDNEHALHIIGLLYHLSDLSGDPAHRALGLRAEGNVHSIGRGEYPQAIDCYNRAAAIYQDLGRPVDQAQSQIGAVWALANLGRYDEVFQTQQWVSRILEEHGEWLVLAGLTANIAIVYGRMGDDTRSLDMIERALALYEKVGMEGEPAWLWAQQNKAVALRNLGRFQESLQASRTAWEGLAEQGQKIAAARARQNLAITYFLLGRYNESLDHMDHVRDVFLADGRQHDAGLLDLFISDCLLQLRRFDQVLEKCRKARTLFAELGTQLFVGQAIVNEAVAYVGLGRHAQALQSLAEARRIFEAEGNQVLIASSDLERASVLLRQDRPSESLAVAQECAAVFRAHSLPVEEAQALLVAARAALQLEQYEQAMALAEGALAIGREGDVPTLKYQGQHLLGAAASARGDRGAALAAFDRAIEEVERLRGRLMVEFRVGFFEDKETLYEDAVGLCLAMDDPRRGLEYAERAKSRALLDLVAYRLDLGIQARQPEDQPLVDELLRLRSERDRRYRRWEWDGETTERGWTSSTGERGQAQQEVLALENQITELWHRLLIRNADYARDASLWTVRAEAVEPYLDEQTLLIEYFAIRGRLVAFLVTEESVQALPLESDLASSQRLIQLLWLNLKAVPKSGADRRAGLEANVQGVLNRLYHSLMAPLAGVAASYARLVIVPHGALHYLPFHALYDGSAYLLQRHEVSYLPGASFARYCHQVPPAGSGFLAVGHSYDGRLPFTAREAQEVAALFGGRVFVEDEATLASLEREMAGCRAIHIAAHGDFRPDNPLFSGLALADGWLTTLDIFDLRLNASLVTLSACQTGRNVVGGGDELLGMMRGFLSAGAASLLLSLWAVEDRSTAMLMGALYRKLAKGWSKGQALRHAQLSFLREQEEPEVETLSHPYYWAAFFLVGNAGPL